MKKPKIHSNYFIPATSPRKIADNVYFQAIKSWHSGTYAGEKLKTLPYSSHGDRSGCLGDNGLCYPPLTVIHRIYWNTNNPDKYISAFLSYPNGMGVIEDYFWETLGTDKEGDIERFIGEDAEMIMEKKIIKVLKKEK